ncbi:MAG: 30S ribosomal protein S6 [Clostridia bacterium]|nr:30S ribosomal protein S6 [Clostridia bacterium]
MNNYEVLYIIENSLDEAAKEAAITKFEGVVTSNGGTVDKIDKWGSKKLAYPIDYKTDGYYVLMTFASASDLPRELERQMRISDEIIRFLVIRK